MTWWKLLFGVMVLAAIVDIAMWILLIRNKFWECIPIGIFSVSITTLGVVAIGEKIGLWLK